MQQSSEDRLGKGQSVEWTVSCVGWLAGISCCQRRVRRAEVQGSITSSGPDEALALFLTSKSQCYERFSLTLPERRARQSHLEFTCHPSCPFRYRRAYRAWSSPSLSWRHRPAISLSGTYYRGVRGPRRNWAGQRCARSLSCTLSATS